MLRVTGRTRSVTGWLSLALVAAALPLSASPVLAATSTLAITPSADTYVSSGAPSSSFGTSGSLYADASSIKQSFLRFSVSGLTGRTVSSVKLRLYQRGSSPHGGSVHRISSNSWTESTTWGTRPSIDGPALASFGSVSSGSWYEVELGSGTVTGDGGVSLAIQSSNPDGSRWASREGSNDPQLIITSTSDTPASVDGVSEVMSPSEGSSDPTYHPSNHRMDVTSSGRLFAVVGRHATGVQLVWKDAGGSWNTKTTGSVSSGLLENNGTSGDRPASLAVTTDASGREQAWVAWSGASSSSAVGVYMRRLTDLNSAGGPSVGPLVTVASQGQGNSKVDLQFERDASGASRGVLSWLQRTSSTSWALKAAWFTDLASATPAIRDISTIFSTASGARTGTLVPTPSGMRLVAKGSGGRMTVYSHPSGSALTTWNKGVDGIAMSSSASVSATSLSTGETVAVSESDATNNVVTVHRFSAAGDSVVSSLQVSGYSEPTIASDGSRIWVVMLRASDGVVVSRLFTPGSGWSGDRLEIGRESASSFSWPNAVRTTDGRLRIIVGGTIGGTYQRAVLAFQRTI